MTNNITITTEVAENKEECTTDNIQNVHTGVYVHKLKKPFEYEGEKYEELTFDFNKLTGRDLEDIETELSAQGHFVTSPEFSSRYAYKLAAKAAGIHSNVIESLPLFEANAIRRAAKNFLLYGD